MVHQSDISLFPHYCASMVAQCFSWQKGWLLGVPETKTARSETKGEGRKREGREPEGWRCWAGFPASLCQGFPNSHLGCATRGLPRHIPEYWLHSPHSLSFLFSLCPFSTVPSSWPRQWIKEIVYTQRKSKQRGDTSWRLLPTTAGRFFSSFCEEEKSRKLALCLPVLSANASLSTFL